jgi:hypothetical protein
MSRWFPILLLITCSFSCNKLRNWKYNPPNVLLISVEGLNRALPCYGDTTFDTPNIDRLAMRSVVFEEALAQHPTSLLALTSIYTGWYPSLTEPFPGDKKYAHSLFPELEAADYQILFPGVESVQDSPYWATQWVEQDDVETPEKIGNSAVTEQVLTLWSKFENSAFFINAHYRMTTVGSGGSDASYQAALSQVDREIGKLLDELMERQEASNTIVVLVGLNPMGILQADSPAQLMPSFVKVPLLYYDFEADSSRRVPHLTELRSLFPTFAERCVEGRKPHPCNAPSLQQMLDGSFRSIQYSALALSQGTYHTATYTSDYLLLPGPAKKRKLFRLSGLNAEQLNADTTFSDSLATMASRKYKLSTVD